MEGAPEKSNGAENFPGLDTLIKEGREKAMHRIAEIEGYDNMEMPQKIVALNALFQELEKDNANRHTAREVSRECDRLKLTEEYKEHMAQLDVTLQNTLYAH